MTRTANIIFFSFVLIIMSALIFHDQNITGNALLSLKRIPAKTVTEKTSPDPIIQKEKASFVSNFFQKTSNLISFRKQVIPLKPLAQIEEPIINISFGDSDGGINENISGVCRDSERVLNDTCSDIWENMLMEAFEEEINTSTGTKIYCTYTSIYCRSRCFKGACRQATDILQPKQVIPLTRERFI